MHANAASPTDPELLGALRYAVERALRAPSVHNTQPWQLETDGRSVRLRADRTRQLTAVDPRGRELVQSVGAALLNLRVALAARSWACEIDRLPDPDDPDLLALVHPVPGRPEAELAPLDPAIARRRTNRRQFTPETVPPDVLRRLAATCAAEETELVPVVSEDHRRLVARLTQQADEWQNADNAYRAELRRWTTRPASARDGVPAAAVPHVDGAAHDDLPLRDFDTTGTGGLPAGTTSGVTGTLVLLATLADEPGAWLRSGEAMERMLLELTQLGYAASPVTQAVEVPLTRSQLRAALSWGAHPQLLLRIGRAAATPATPRRRQDEILHGDEALVPPPRAARAPQGERVPAPARRPHPVSDGRGGTTWI